MTISQSDRERFRQIGKERLALAMATGTLLQSFSITEDKKAAAIEWVKEQEAEEEKARERGATAQSETLRWAKIAAWAGIASVIVGVLAIIATLVVAYIQR